MRKAILIFSIVGVLYGQETRREIVNAAPTPKAMAQQATYLVATSSQFQVER